MILTQHTTPAGPKWALSGHPLPDDTTLNALLRLRRKELSDLSAAAQPEEVGPLMAPIGGEQEVWASGVTYLRSRLEREAESTVADVYAKVYAAERPEIFFKALGWRVSGHLQDIRVRRDSGWNVPEPELVLVINAHGEILGYTAGNDVSSRSIEGENPLYLPQAKSYDGSCALGPGIVLTEDLEDIPIELSILRSGEVVYADSANTSQMKRRFSELVDYLFREMSFPNGVFLMTGTGIVPDASFTLISGDEVTVKVGELTLINYVA